MTQTIASAALETAAQQQNRRVSARVVDDPAKPVLANEYLQKQVLALMPGLKRYARVLTRDAVAADDLLQDCLARALEKIHLWEPGTDLRAWLFTILHHRHISHTRRDARRRDYLKSQQPASSLALSPEQPARLELRDLERGLAKLPEEQRSAILLVGLDGMDYAQAAAVMNIPLGTVRSRIARGRESLRNVTGLFPARHARSNGTAHLVSQGRSRSGRKDFQPSPQGVRTGAQIAGGRPMKLLPLAILACLAATPVGAQQREVGPMPQLHAVNPSMSLAAPANNNPLQEQMRQDYATDLMGSQRELLQQNPSGLGRQEQAIGSELNGYTPR